MTELRTARSPIRPGPMAIDRISTGRLHETDGYRVIRDRGSQDHLLILTTGGTGLVRFPAGTHTTVVGDVILYKPDAPQDYGTGADHDWQIVFCHFHPRPDWGPLLTWPELAPGLHRLHLLGDHLRRAEASLSTMVHWGQSGHRQSRLLALNALELALLWCDAANPDSGALDPRISEALQTLDNRIADDLSVESLARSVHLSASRLSHLFTSQVGTPPMAYLEQQRIARAKMYLELTDRSVAEIAAMVGFGDPFYFSTRFRRLVGTTPSAHRRDHRRVHSPSDLGEQ